VFSGRAGSGRLLTKTLLESMTFRPIRVRTAHGNLNFKSPHYLRGMAPQSRYVVADAVKPTHGPESYQPTNERKLDHWIDGGKGPRQSRSSTIQLRWLC
jgi:hypothetical protein